MIDIDITKLVPRFVLRDKNGYALAKAIEAGLRAANKAIKEGAALIDDYTSMPEWRLDELAWETGCLYDYSADVEAKRCWIRDALPLYRLYGTKQAVYSYIGSYFDGVDVEENWEYGGEPYHFRVTVDGEWTPENEAWMMRAIDRVKNVRSILDGARVGTSSCLGFTAEGAVAGRFSYPMASVDSYAGRWPDNSRLGIISEPAVGLEGESKEYGFAYLLAGKEQMAGTFPQENTLGVVDRDGNYGTQAEDSFAAIEYKLCGQDEI